MVMAILVTMAILVMMAMASQVTLVVVRVIMVFDKGNGDGREGW